MPNHPRPAAMRLLQGNPGKRGVSRAIRDQVKAGLATGRMESTVGDPPESMPKDGDARQTWVRLQGVCPWLSEADREMLEAFCYAVDMMRNKPKWFRLAATTIKSVGAELGLSPVARERLGNRPKAPAKASDLPPELTVTANPTGA